MALGTVISRITGLLRDIAMTAALGLGIVADIFTVGNTIPNTVYVLTVGGAMNAVFVPQLVRRSREDSDGGAGFTDRLLTLTCVLLLALTAIAMLLAPLLTRIYASPEYTADQMSLAVAFARFCLPQVFFYGLFTLVSQVLNARGRFYPPMYAPIANNLVAIGVFLVASWPWPAPRQRTAGRSRPQQTAWLGHRLHRCRRDPGAAAHPVHALLGVPMARRGSTGAAGGWARPAGWPCGPWACSPPTRSPSSCTAAWPRRPTSWPRPRACPRRASPPTRRPT